VLVGVVAIGPYCSLLLSGDLVLKDSIYSDYGSYQLPVREFAQQEFAAGRFPLWIPWLGCGIPVHATAQIGVCYPLLTPFLFVPSANRAIKLSLFIHVVICYVGKYRLGRTLRLTPTGAAIAGLIATQSGFMTGHLVMGHVCLVQAYALLPWFFASVMDACTAPTWCAVCRLAVVAAALLLVGHPQVSYYGFLFGAVGVVGWLLCGQAAARPLQVLAALAAAAVLALLLAAVQILPTMELVRDSTGSSPRGTAEYAAGIALDGPDVYRLAVPSLKGNPMMGLPEFDPPDFYHEKVCYLGIMAWLLALTRLLCSPRRDWSLGAAGLIAFGIVIALGRSTMFFDAIGRVVPGAVPVSLSRTVPGGRLGSCCTARRTWLRHDVRPSATHVPVTCDDGSRATCGGCNRLRADRAQADGIQHRQVAVVCAHTPARRTVREPAGTCRGGGRLFCAGEDGSALGRAGAAARLGCRPRLLQSALHPL
jgi:hypothetical protein